MDGAAPLVMAPLTRADEIGPLVEAGATEFYCGVGSDELLGRYTNLFPLNAREMAHASVRGEAELRRIVDALRERRVPLWLAFNLSVPAAQIDDWWQAVDRAVDAGVEGMILGSPALAAALRRRHPHVVLDVSCLGGAFNREALDFWVDLGARRVTLPRQMKRTEICALAEARPAVELCVFAASTACFFSNAFCGTRHGMKEARHPRLAVAARFCEALLAGPLRPLSRPVGGLKDAMERSLLRREGPPCFRSYEGRWPDGRTVADFRFYGHPARHAWACALCALGPLLRAGVRAFKITSRDHPLRRRLVHTRLVARGLDLARTLDDPGSLAAAMRELFRAERGCDCGGRFCYYPD